MNQYKKGERDALILDGELVCEMQLPASCIF